MGRYLIMNRYIVDFYMKAVTPYTVAYRTKKEALKAMSEYITAIRETCTSKRGFVKRGNLQRDGQLTVEHKAFVYEGASFFHVRNGYQILQLLHHFHVTFLSCNVQCVHSVLQTV